MGSEGRIKTIKYMRSVIDDFLDKHPIFARNWIGKSKW